MAMQILTPNRLGRPGTTMRLCPERCPVMGLPQLLGHLRQRRPACCFPEGARRSLIRGLKERSHHPGCRQEEAKHARFTWPVWKKHDPPVCSHHLMKLLTTWMFSLFLKGTHLDGSHPAVHVGLRVRLQHVGLVGGRDDGEGVRRLSIRPLPAHGCRQQRHRVLRRLLPVLLLLRAWPACASSAGSHVHRKPQAPGSHALMLNFE